MRTKIFLSMVVALFILASPLHAKEYGMYVEVVENIDGTFENAVKDSERALGKYGWQVLASYRDSVPEGCSFKAHTIVAYSPGYAKQIMALGPKLAFALPMRIGIYENEQGINVAFVNPASLIRTILGDDTAKELSVNAMYKLSDVLSSEVTGQVVNRQIGQIRSKGKVGGMGGGDFNKKIEEKYAREFSNSDFEETARKVKEGILANKEGWQLVYSLALGDNPVIIYGVNKPRMEVKAFSIAGEKRASKDNPCPGVDHVAAFPIEVVVYKEANMIKVVVLDGMYRMKLYFEDAGMWAFMKNMGMPGEIEGEIVEMSTSLLRQ